MAKMNESFLELKTNYLFAEIANRVRAFEEANPNPELPLIRMGIGDVKLPIPQMILDAGKKSLDELGVAEAFRGYEDSGRGYLFAREAVASYYASFGVEINADDVFISDGAKSDTGNIGDLFSPDSVVIITDPVYPVYDNASIMRGHRVVRSNFVTDELPEKADIIYLCSPNNPTGDAYTFEQLKKWVCYAKKVGAVIIYDSAYEAFIQEPDKCPSSIFEIEGAKECAIEIASLSKNAGFTGIRAGYTIVHKELMLEDAKGEKVSLAELWKKRQASKFNGVNYSAQRMIESALSFEGQQALHENIKYYQENARIIMDALTELGIKFTGGVNSPYVWFKCPNTGDSWEFFDFLLNKVHVVGTPGIGFGANGAGMFRLTAFSTRENTTEAMRRFREKIPTVRNS